jgi:hypothetical protein
VKIIAEYNDRDNVNAFSPNPPTAKTPHESGGFWELFVEGPPAVELPKYRVMERQRSERKRTGGIDEIKQMEDKVYEIEAESRAAHFRRKLLNEINPSLANVSEDVPSPERKKLKRNSPDVAQQQEHAYDDTNDDDSIIDVLCAELHTASLDTISGELDAVEDAIDNDDMGICAELDTASLDTTIGELDAVEDATDNDELGIDILRAELETACLDKISAELDAVEDVTDDDDLVIDINRTDLGTACLAAIREELDAVEDLEAPECLKTDPPKSNDATGQENTKEENENSPTWKERLILFYHDNEFLAHVICVICLARGKTQRVCVIV